MKSGNKSSNNYETLFEDTHPSDDVDVYNPKAKTLTTPVLGEIVRVERQSTNILAICEFEVFAGRDRYLLFSHPFVQRKSAFRTLIDVNLILN